MASTVQEQIRETAERYGVDPALALAVAQQESGFDQSARGTSGEVGVFQLMPGTASDLGVNPYDLSQNIDGGVRYLAQQLNRFGSTETALAAYNAGPGAAARGSVPRQAWDYAKSVLRRVGLFSIAEPEPGLVAETPSYEAPGGEYSLAVMAPSFDKTGLLILAGVGVVVLFSLLKRD